MKPTNWDISPCGILLGDVRQFGYWPFGKAYVSIFRGRASQRRRHWLIGRPDSYATSYQQIWVTSQKSENFNYTGAVASNLAPNLLYTHFERKSRSIFCVRNIPSRFLEKLGTRNICRLNFLFVACCFIISKPNGHVMNQQFNIQQLYALPTLYLCVLYLSENKQRLVPLTA